MVRINASMHKSLKLSPYKCVSCSFANHLHDIKCKQAYYHSCTFFLRLLSIYKCRKTQLKMERKKGVSCSVSILSKSHLRAQIRIKDLYFIFSINQYTDDLLQETKHYF